MGGTANDSTRQDVVLVLGGTGKTGRRVVEGLEALGVSVRIGSRHADVPFDWDAPATWARALRNVRAVYVSFYPDLSVPGAPATIRAFTEQAVRSGVRRLALLSGRGEDEAQHCETIVQGAGVEWTVIRASWFCQNFNESFLHDLVMSGEVALPIQAVGEPFIDADDIAEIAVAALTDDRHIGQLYEVTGPRLLTFADAVAEIAAVTGRPIGYAQTSLAAFEAAMAEQGVPADAIDLMRYLFTTVLDGRNAHVTDGVQRALGRPPKAGGAGRIGLSSIRKIGSTARTLRPIFSNAAEQ